MDPLEGLLFGLRVVLSPENLIAGLIGALAGTMIGVLPGLGPVGGAAVLLPFTFTLSPTAAPIMIAAIYYGVQYGGSTTSVLLNMPGEASAVVAGIDGYEMTKQGRAGPALGIMAIGSFLAGTFSALAVAFFSPFLANIGLLFGPAEFFALTGGGLLVLSRLMGGRLTSGLFPMGIGVMLGTIGLEGVTGTSRFTLGFLELSQGVSLITAAVGLYGVAEIITTVVDPLQSGTVQKVKFREMFPTREDLRRSLAPWLRGGVLGFLLGLLPGPSATMSTFMSYRLERAVSKNRAQLGKGAVEGIAGPEAANNAGATASMIPVLSLGLPFSATLALLLAALIVQGVQPGPLIITQNPDIFWGVIASMLVGNLILLILNFPMIGMWVSLLRIPTKYLLTGVLVIAVAGTYAARSSMLDVYSIVPLGILGFVLRRYDFHLAPLLIGIILGPLVERHFREALFLSGGNVNYLFFERPIASVIWLLVLVALLTGPGVKLIRGFLRRGADEEHPTSTGEASLDDSELEVQ